MTSIVSGSRVVVVDDEPGNVRILERILSAAGYTNVVTMTDPRELLARWEELDPDLLLLDLMMPELDGFQVMESLGARTWASDAPYVPILVLTADATRNSRLRALSCGAKDFLTKPFDHDEIRLRIANLLESRALHLALARSNHLLEQRVAQRTEELQRSLEQLEVAHADLRSSREETIRRLSIAAELRDDATGRHIIRMSRYTGLLARAIGVNEERANLIELAVQMHDVGKIGVPDQVLLKPGTLTPEERTMMERHAEIGHDVLKGGASELLSVAATIALTHHERVDGGGYPNGLHGEEIPIEGRLAAVADVFDALMSDRIYRPALTLQEALEVMRRGRGSHFDADLLDVFVDHTDDLLEARAEIQRNPMPV